MRTSSPMGMVQFSHDRPRLAEIDSLLNRCKARPTGSCVTRIGGLYASTLLAVVPVNRVANFRTAVEARAATPFAAGRPARGGVRRSLMVIGEDNRGVMSRVALGPGEAGGTIEKFDARVFRGDSGPGMFAIDMEVMTPATVSFADLLRTMMRTAPGDRMRIYDRATGRVLARREVGTAGRPPSAGSRGERTRQIVLASDSRDQGGIVGNVGAFLARNGADVERATGYTAGGRFIGLFQAWCDADGHEAILANYRRALAAYNVKVATCHWGPAGPDTLESGVQVAVDELDDPTGVSPLVRVRDTAARHGVVLGRVSLRHYAAAFFGTPMARVEAVARGPAANTAGFTAEIEQWEDGGVGVGFAPAAPFAHEGELYQPLRTIMPRDRDEWHKSFTDEA